MPKSRFLEMINELTLPPESDALKKAAAATKAQDEQSKPCAQSEMLNWLDVDVGVPIWSRLYKRNAIGRERGMALAKYKKYDIEIDKRLWSLWGTVHPHDPIFHSKSRGKQYLACNVVACCAASVYQLAEWKSELLDNIVINGDKYHRDSMAKLKRQDRDISLRQLNSNFGLETLRFALHLQRKFDGKLFSHSTKKHPNLAETLTDFFSSYRFGILQCQRRLLAIGFVAGVDGGYFMFDCQSREHPLFAKNQGASYILRCKQLPVLHHCLVATLNKPYDNMQFNIFAIDVNLISDPTQVKRKTRK